MADKWILIVDDDDSILSILKNSLIKLGHEYQVVTASDGYQALDQLKQFHFDLVVTDYKMAGMNGLELLDKIHQAQTEVRGDLDDGLRQYHRGSRSRTLKGVSLFVQAAGDRDLPAGRQRGHRRRRGDGAWRTGLI